MRVLKYWLEGLVVLPFVVLVVITFLQVLFRFVFHYPAAWTTDVVSISFIWFIFLGSALAVRTSDHITVDVLDKLPQLLQKIVIVAGNIAIIIFLVLLTYYGFQHAMNSMNQIIPSINMPKGYVYLVVPLSGILMIYYMLRNLVKTR